METSNIITAVATTASVIISIVFYLKQNKDNQYKNFLEKLKENGKLYRIYHLLKGCDDYDLYKPDIFDFKEQINFFNIEFNNFKDKNIIKIDNSLKIIYEIIALIDCCRVVSFGDNENKEKEKFFRGHFNNIKKVKKEEIEIIKNKIWDIKKAGCFFDNPDNGYIYFASYTNDSNNQSSQRQIVNSLVLSYIKKAKEAFEKISKNQ